MAREAAIPQRSLTIPSSGNITAPPETPMIISADTSLDRSGFSFNAKEKMMEKRLAQASPMMKMADRRIHPSVATVRGTNAAMANSRDTFRNRIGETLSSRNEPTSVPAIFAKK